MEVEKENATDLNWSQVKKVKISIIHKLDNHFANFTYNLCKIFFQPPVKPIFKEN